jgi:hypothetical protein
VETAGRCASQADCDQGGDSNDEGIGRRGKERASLADAAQVAGQQQGNYADASWDGGGREGWDGRRDSGRA